MDKIEEAREILKFVGMPKAQQSVPGSEYSVSAKFDG